MSDGSILLGGGFGLRSGDAQGLLQRAHDGADLEGGQRLELHVAQDPTNRVEMVVPAVEPSVFQSSRPDLVFSAAKYATCPRGSKMKGPGREPTEPG